MSSSWSSLSVWDWLTIAGTFLVLVGVAGEFVNRRRKFKYKPVPDDPSPIEERQLSWAARKELYEYIWELILVAGLVLDLVVIPRQLVETGRLNKEAADARKMAGEASERAQALESTNLALRARIVDLESNEVESIDQIMHLQKGNVPRALLLALQPTKFQDALKGKPTTFTQIWYKPEDSEAEQFAIVIFNTLHSVDWPAFFGPIPTNMVEPSYRGKPEFFLRLFTSQFRATGTLAPLVLFSRNTTNNAPALAIFNAFASAGFPVDPRTDSDLPPDRIVLVVGQNQPPLRVYKLINPKTQKPWNE
jgi:hypothetical protein